MLKKSDKYEYMDFLCCSVCGGRTGLMTVPEKKWGQVCGWKVICHHCFREGKA